MVLEELVKDIIESQRIHIQEKLPLIYPSIPILYFGDLEAYQQSKLKVVTVGLSPSHLEFPHENRFTRFKDIEKINLNDAWTEKDVYIYLNSLNNYFRNNPYYWFNAYEPMLNGMNTSFYGKKVNTALHTDLCSPHATYPTWSKLGESEQNTLRIEGGGFWQRLVEYLEPDIMLISIARKYTNIIKFRKSKWRIHSNILNKKDGTPRSKPYDIEISDCQVGKKKGYMVFGQAAQMPFGTLSTEHKEDVGKSLFSSII